MIEFRFTECRYKMCLGVRPMIFHFAPPQAPENFPATANIDFIPQNRKKKIMVENSKKAVSGPY